MSVFTGPTEGGGGGWGGGGGSLVKCHYEISAVQDIMPWMIKLKVLSQIVDMCCLDTQSQKSTSYIKKTHLFFCSVYNSLKKYVN